MEVYGGTDTEDPYPVGTESAATYGASKYCTLLD